MCFVERGGNLNTAYLDMIQGKNPGITPVWYMRQAGRSQAAYRKIKREVHIVRNYQTTRTLRTSDRTTC